MQPNSHYFNKVYEKDLIDKYYTCGDSFQFNKFKAR